MAYLSDDELLDTEGDFTGWDDGTGAGAAEETLEQALAEERLAELENELEQDEHPIDYEAELESEEEEASPVSEKRLKRELRAEAIRRLEEAARTEKDFRAVVEEWNKLDRNTCAAAPSQALLSHPFCSGNSVAFPLSTVLPPIPYFLAMYSSGVSLILSA